MKTVKKPRFLVNPFEIIVFLVVLTFSGVSFYRLFFDWNENSSTTNLSGSQKNVISTERSLATTSTPSLFYTFNYNCLEQQPNQVNKSISAERVRIIGSFCAQEAKRSPNSIHLDKQKITKVEVTNLTNQTKATVFEESSLKGFTTDYISLEPGENKIDIIHYYKNGQKKSDQIKITRN